MQRERAARKERRITRLAKIISLTILIGIPFILGIVLGRATKHVPTAPAYQVKAEAVEEYTAPEYVIPDACELAVVQCPGEAEYNGQQGE